MPEHSPLPWKRAEDGECKTIGIFWEHCRQITDATGMPIAAVWDDDQRARIINSVNMHDELVKSLDDASWYISQCEDGGSAGAQKLHDHVRALLAKAKGET
jgi:hypothetical protein